MIRFGIDAELGRDADGGHRRGQCPHSVNLNHNDLRTKAVGTSGNASTTIAKADDDDGLTCH